jgi:hypothetical protein
VTDTVWRMRCKCGAWAAGFKGAVDMMTFLT